MLDDLSAFTSVMLLNPLDIPIKTGHPGAILGYLQMRGARHPEFVTFPDYSGALGKLVGQDLEPLAPRPTPPFLLHLIRT